MSYKKERQTIEHRLRELKRESSPDLQRIKEVEIELKVLESDRLRERAKHWGFDLVEAVGPWDVDADNTRFRIAQDKHYAQAEKLIKEAQYTYWKKWVDLISPVASVVISILAFALAATALYLQLIGRLR